VNKLERQVGAPTQKGELLPSSVRVRLALLVPSRLPVTDGAWSYAWIRFGSGGIVPLSQEAQPMLSILAGHQRSKLFDRPKVKI
jgi:hypothetical protein